MYLVAIAWAYVVLMMSLAEALSAQGTVLGALFTLLLYGVLPLSVLMYILGTPLRRRARLEREREESAQIRRLADSGAPILSGTSSVEPDRRSEPARDTVAPVGKEP